jgi:tetratricopeptide (TPR) repeat protein
MTTIIELRNQAKELKDQKQYSEALLLYQQCWQEYPNEHTPWDGWFYAFCLAKENRYQEMRDICQEVHKLDKTFEPIKSQYAWAIYYTEIKVDKIDNIGKFLKYAQVIITLCNQADQYGPYTRVVFEVIKNFKQPYHPEQILQWLAKLAPTQLREDTFSFEDSSGKQREMASDKEQYYALKAKALLHVGKYQECIETCNTALLLFKEFHYDNDIWFKKHIACATFKQGDSNKALEILTSLLQRRKEWFIEYEIAEIYGEMGDNKNALNYAIDAALNYGDMQMKLGVYQYLALLLQKDGRKELAKKHVELIYKIRTEKEWKIDHSLINDIAYYQISAEMLPSSQNIYQQLKRDWENIKFENREKFNGVIRNILPLGKAGFIDTKSKQSYYFKISAFKGPKNKIVPGLQVTFYIEDSFDHKKQCMSQIAVNVVPI